jgi:pSer/pThr/pTyr-binding forkhead associated (FHA) protein
MEVRFVFKSSSGKPKVHSKRLPILVGRSDASDVKLRIPKDSVSRRHCEFVLDDKGQVCVRDLESTNGTFLAGRQLQPRVATPVPSGGLIKLGNVGFRVEYATAQRDASPHDSDTIPIDSTTEPLPPAGPAGDAVELEPAEAADLTVPAPPPGGEAEPLAEPGELPADEISAAGPAAAGEFGFLAAAEAEPDGSPAGEDQWPVADDGPTAGGDKNLDDFFKGLS